MSTVYTPNTSIWHSTIVIPDDSNKRSSAVQNVPPCAALDNAAYIRSRQGLWFLAAYAVLGNAGTSEIADQTANTFGTNNVLLATILSTLQYDYLEAQLQFTAGMPGNTPPSTAEFRLAATFSGGAMTELTGARTLLNTLTTTEQAAKYTRTLHSIFGVPAAGGTALVYLQGRFTNAAGSDAVKVYQPFSGAIRLWRSTT